ncbi:MAG: glycosyltransferase family 2 protein [Terrimesophilobacter sp.]
MQPRVVAIFVAHSGAEGLDRALAALTSQTRPVDVLLAIELSEGIRGADSASPFSAAGATQVLSLPGGTPFGEAVAHAMKFAPPSESESEWLWLLGEDNVPAPDALEKLLGAVEIAPSVGVAGPKLMDRRDPTLISELGLTISRFGATVSLVNDELDQGQYDTRDDVLGVSAAGMLVRRGLWSALGGFDPGLPTVDAGLDFSLRVRLNGYRVIVVPEASVTRAGGPELFGRGSSSSGRTFRLTRTAQLHRRLVYSPSWALAFHWLALMPLAILRSLGDLIAKRPGAIGGEITAAFTAAFSGGIGAARRNLRKGRRLGWAAIAALRMPTSEVRERRMQAREAAIIDADPGSVRAFAQSDARAGFIAHGGLWVMLLTALVSLLAYGSLIGAEALTGGALRPITHTVAELWSNMGIGWRHVGTGAFGAADPFAAVLAVLGSLTWWSPSFSVVLLYLLALPLAALGAWFAARRLSRNPWMPTLAAILWAFSPPLLTALSGGHLGALIAHLLLPWLVFAALGAARSWAAGGAAALLFAAVAASAPSLVPAVLVLFVVLLVARPTKIHRVVGIPIPALVLFAPLIVQQTLRANPLGLLADPGVPVAGTTASGWQLALGDATGTLHGWPSVLASLSSQGASAPGLTAPLLVSVLLAPLGILALLALFLPGARRAIPMLVVALLGYATAVLSSVVHVGADGSAPVTVWAGSGLSLLWLGLIGASLIALEALGRSLGPLSVLTAVTAVALAIPLVGAIILGASAVQPSNGRILPALVGAQAAGSPFLGTLVLTSEGDKGVAVRLERGLGASLDDQSTLVSTKPAPTESDKRLAVLAGNLATKSGFDYAAELAAQGISFILVPESADGDETRVSAVQSLSSNEALTPVGVTSTGQLWRFDSTVTAPEFPTTALQRATSFWYLLALGVVFGVTILLAVPIGGRPRKPRAAPAEDEPAGTFVEEEHD